MIYYGFHLFKVYVPSIPLTHFPLLLLAYFFRVDIKTVRINNKLM